MKTKNKISKKMLKKAFGVLLVIALFFGMCSPAAPYLPKISFNASAAGDIIASGTCGGKRVESSTNEGGYYYTETVNYCLYDDGTLEITGEGEILGDVFTYWNFDYCDYVTEIVIGSGITKINGGAFGYLYNLKEVTILNPDCYIDYGYFDEGYTFPCGIVFYGYEGSTTQAFVERYAGYDEDFNFLVYCPHENTEGIPAIEPLCYASGYSDGIKCKDCGRFVSGGEELFPSHIDENDDGICERCDKTMPVESGACGGNVLLYDDMDGWEYDGAARYYLYADGTLEILGEGIIATGRFSGDSNIEKLIVYDGIKSIYIDELASSLAFSGCKNLKSVELADSITEIDCSAFSGCSGLESIKLPSKLSYIDFSLFSDCTSLKSIEIPDSVIKIRSGAFKNCTSLKSIVIPGSVKELGSYNWDLASFEGSVFEGCTSLESVELNEGLESIGSEAFSNCHSLKEVNLPSTVKTIGQEAFYNCLRLENATIPESVTSLGKGLFTNCIRLSRVNIMNPECEILYDRDTLPETAVIYGYSGSTAEKYATDWLRKFVPFDKEHDHEFESKVTLKPTCTSTGVETFTCYCGESYTEVIVPNSHFDFTSDGNCDACGTKLNAGGSNVTPDVGEDDNTTEAPDEGGTTTPPAEDDTAPETPDINDEPVVEEPEAGTSVFASFFESIINFFKNLMNLLNFMKK